MIVPKYKIGNEVYILKAGKLKLVQILSIITESNDTGDRVYYTVKDPTVEDIFNNMLMFNIRYNEDQVYDTPKDFIQYALSDVEE